MYSLHILLYNGIDRVSFRVYDFFLFFFFKQKTAYEMRISDWSSDVCSSDLVPEGRYPAKGVAVDRHPADGGERQVSGHQQLAGRRRLPQQTHPHANRLLGVVFEAVVPVGMVEPDREDDVAGEGQPVAAGRHADHAVPGGVISEEHTTEL